MTHVINLRNLGGQSCWKDDFTEIHLIFVRKNPHISTSVTCESKGNQHSQLEILHFDKGMTSKFRSSEAFSG